MENEELINEIMRRAQSEEGRKMADAAFKRCKDREITFEDFCDPEFRRNEQMKLKSEAVWVAFLELNGLINVSKFAKKYFNKTQAWFLQRLRGYEVNHKQVEFTANDYQKISQSFRELANQLNEYADAIDKAE